MRNLLPEHPHDAGLAEEVPQLAQIEGAELLANEARTRLLAAGFTDREVAEWALTYIADEGSGDLDSFLQWIEEQESAAQSSKHRSRYER